MLTRPLPRSWSHPALRPWKGGILAAAAKHNLAVVFPDTSPRGAGIEGEDKDWDFGTGQLDVFLLPKSVSSSWTR